jgi:hypothetical protein
VEQVELELQIIQVGDLQQVLGRMFQARTILQAAAAGLLLRMAILLRLVV